MKYSISQKNDINHGVMLTVQLPAEEVDWNALHTLEVDLPGFVVPFHYHMVDDMVEMTFQPGSRRMLRYFGGEKRTDDYAQMFIKLLNPLQICMDWFMNPMCLVLDFNWVYMDGSDDTISYLYLPVKEAFMSLDDLVQMVRLVNNNVTISDAALENKVLHSITDDCFTISEFLKIFQSAAERKPEVVQVKVTPKVPEKLPEKEIKIPEKIEKPVEPKKSKKEPKAAVAEKKTKERQPEVQQFADIPDDDDDLFISDQWNNEKDKQTEKSDGLFKKLFGSNEEKQREKEEKKQKQREKELEKQLEKQREKEDRRRKKEEKKNGAKVNNHNVISGAVELVNSEQEEKRDPFAELFSKNGSQTVVMDKTYAASGTRLEYIGRGDHEPVIAIRMGKSNMFKIGRFDTVLNEKQSDFEFPANTKEVSRRHAVIELIDGAYYLVDIGSMAGTYVNGHRLGLNEKFLLQSGDMVSFGKAGADYAFYQAN